MRQRKEHREAVVSTRALWFMPSPDADNSLLIASACDCVTTGIKEQMIPGFLISAKNAAAPTRPVTAAWSCHQNPSFGFN